MNDIHSLTLSGHSALRSVSQDEDQAVTGLAAIPSGQYQQLLAQTERFRTTSVQLSGASSRKLQLESRMQQRLTALTALPENAHVKRNLLQIEHASDVRLLAAQSQQAQVLRDSVTAQLNKMRPGLQSLQAAMPVAAHQSLIAPLQLALTDLPAAASADGTDDVDPSEKPGWDTEDQAIDSAFWNHLVDVIGTTKINNTKLGDVVEGFVGYFNEMSNFLYTDHISVITSGDNKGKYNVDYSGMHDDYWNNHAVKWDGKVICQDVTEEQYEDIGKKMFGSDYRNWIQFDNGSIKMNAGSYTEGGVTYKNPVNDAMYNRLIDGGLHSVMEAQDVNTWEQQFDAQRTVLSNMSNDMAQKLSRANSTFDNVIKVLSSTISSMLEIDKAYMKW